MLQDVQDRTVAILAEELATYTGESVTNAIATALRERLQRVKSEGRVAPHSLPEVLLRIGQECAALPVIDNRTADEILGYNELGLPA